MLNLSLRRATAFAIAAAVTLLAAPQPTHANGSVAGEFRLSPSDPQQVRSVAQVTYEITLGDGGLQPGGSVLLYWNRSPEASRFALQNATVTSSQPGARFQTSLNADADESGKGLLRITLKGAAMQAGDTITARGTLRYAQFTNVAGIVRAAVQATAGSDATILPQAYPIRLTPGPLAQIKVTTVPRPISGAPSRLNIAMLDKSGNPLVDYRGTISFSANRAVPGLPQSYTFKPSDAGAREFTVKYPVLDQVYRVSVTAGAVKGLSNPALPRSPTQPAIYFGEVHTHGTFSADGLGDLDDAYDYGKRISGLDFGAVSEHSPSDPAVWQTITAIGNRHNEAGRFATLLGYEWSDPTHGHRNVYYRAGGPAKPDLPDNMGSLWNFLDRTNTPALTIPHHPNTAWTGKNPWSAVDWSVINSKYQRLVEIFQSRGSFEVPGGPNPELRVLSQDFGSSGQTALAIGHRVGFIASTDFHNGRVGTALGATGVYARSLSRTSVFDALYNRNCYAVTGDRMIVVFSLNNQPMGSEVTLADPQTTRRLNWRAVGVGSIKRVELIRNNIVAQSWAGNGKDDLSGSFSRTAALTGPEWWYLRVLQENGEMAWSSPIWVNS